MDAWLPLFFIWSFPDLVATPHCNLNATVTLRCQRAAVPSARHLCFTLSSLVGEHSTCCRRGREWTALNQVGMEWKSLWFTFIMLPPCGCCMKIHHCDSSPHTVYPVNLPPCDPAEEEKTHSLFGPKSNIPEGWGQTYLDGAVSFQIHPCASSCFRGIFSFAFNL